MTYNCLKINFKLNLTSVNSPVRRYLHTFIYYNFSLLSILSNQYVIFLIWICGIAIIYLLCFMNFCAYTCILHIKFCIFLELSYYLNGCVLYMIQVSFMCFMVFTCFLRVACNFVGCNDPFFCSC